MQWTWLECDERLELVLILIFNLCVLPCDLICWLSNLLRPKIAFRLLSGVRFISGEPGLHCSQTEKAFDFETILLLALLPVTNLALPYVP